MITLPLAIIYILLAYYKSGFIRKHNLKLYIGFTIITILAFAFDGKFPLSEPFTQGFLGLSLLYTVMFTGALKKKTKLHIKLMSVRKEYSILGFIILSAHATKYFVQFLQGDIPIEWFGVITFVIMIPLFITSFMVIRKKFTFTTWKKIQRFAYIAYILMFVHLLLVFTTKQNLIGFVLMFSVYFILKTKKEVLAYSKKKEKVLAQSTS